MSHWRTYIETLIRRRDYLRDRMAAERQAIPRRNGLITHMMSEHAAIEAALILMQAEHNKNIEEHNARFLQGKPRN